VTESSPGQLAPKKVDVMNLHARMDSQDKMLTEIRDMIVGHIAEEKGKEVVDGPVAKALDEIALLWRASKILVPALVALATAWWAVAQWWNAHFKWS